MVIQDNSRYVRAAAAWTLGQIADPRGVDALSNLLHDIDEDVCWTAARALGKVGEAGVLALVHTLWNEHEPFIVHWAVAEALGWVDNLRAMEVLLATLKNKENDITVRRAAARALGRVGTPLASKQLAEIILDTHEDKDLQETATSAFERIVSPLKTINISGASIKTKQEKVDPLTKERAIQALGQIGDPRPADKLIQMMLNKKEDFYIRLAAVGALGNIDNVDAVQALRNFLQDESVIEDLRGSAAFALANTGYPGAVKILVEVVWDEHAEVRRFAAKGLERVNLSVPPPLLQRLIGQA
jgi:HEAT repeat protein